jgi:hypothetical protein
MSLQQQINKSWLVIGHVTDAVIKLPQFYVSEPGRQRVITSNQKNVHAYSSGILLDPSSVSISHSELREIYYCPYSQSYFTWKDSNERLSSADFLVVIDNRVFCTIDRQYPQLCLF